MVSWWLLLISWIVLPAVGYFAAHLTRRWAREDWENEMMMRSLEATKRFRHHIDLERRPDGTPFLWN